MFIEQARGGMYKFHASVSDKLKTGEQMVPMRVRLPRDRGISGLAINRKEVLVIAEGE